ncbi:MAG: IclR family transcriptional regulator [Acidimicrobiales bacterium]
MAGNSAMTVERAADVLLLFGRGLSPRLGVTEIATKLELSKASVHRILASLRNKGMVELDPTSRKYSLGPVVMSLGLAYLDQLDLRAVAAAELAGLSRQTNETATLSIRSGHSRVYIDQATPDCEVLMSVQIGVPHPLHAGASSKALLAHLPPDEIEGYLAGPLPMLTPTTVVDPVRLRRQLAEIRQRGWARSVGERQPGAASLAAPILDFRHNPLAVISVCGPAERFEPRIETCTRHLLAAAARISSRAGRTDGTATAPN